MTETSMRKCPKCKRIGGIHALGCENASMSEEELEAITCGHCGGEGCSECKGTGRANLAKAFAVSSYKMILLTAEETIRSLEKQKVEQLRYIEEVDGMIAKVKQTIEEFKQKLAKELGG